MVYGHYQTVSRFSIQEETDKCSFYYQIPEDSKELRLQVGFDLLSLKEADRRLEFAPTNPITNKEKIFSDISPNDHHL